MLTFPKFPKQFEVKSYLLLLFLLIAYSVTAINSSGYHHQDEHFQIVQFAEYKIGNTDEVSWEYKERVRSSVQPLVCMLIFSIARALGISDHFHLALTLRLFTAVIGAISIMFYVKSHEWTLSEKGKSILIFLFMTLWFLPYINVRFSSEAYSGFALLWTLTFFNIVELRKKKINFCLIGFFMGLSILFRFQSIFFVFGLLGWLIVIKRESKEGLLLLILSLSLVITGGMLADSYYYGEFTFSILNYFRIHAAGNLSILFGTSPWYEIFAYILFSPSIFIGVIILVSLFVTLTDYRNKLLWGVIPFLFVHALSPHKELRFLFPLVNFTPIIILTAFYRFDSRMKIPYFKYIVGSIFLILNIAGLYVVLLRSTRGGETEVARKIAQYEKANLITTVDANPFEPRIRFKNYFYRPNNVNIIEISSLWDSELSEELILRGYKNFILIRKRDYVKNETEMQLRKLNMKRSLTISDTFMSGVLDCYDKELNDDELILYEQQ